MATLCFNSNENERLLNESRIQVTRELEDKEKDSWLGNWVENYKYRIAMNNYSDQKVKLRLMDRMP